ncbi:hypothetical protein GCM10023085_47210 [Actinomadura viridis]
MRSRSKRWKTCSPTGDGAGASAVREEGSVSIRVETVMAPANPQLMGVVQQLPAAL